MPYLSFDLDALSIIPDVAQSAKITDSQVAYGLLRMWAFCFKKKTDEIDQERLEGFFTGDPRKVSAALISFGFLAPIDGPLSQPTYRVKGATRYLRIKKAQSDAGKKAASNLRQNQRSASESPTGSPPGLPPGRPPGGPGEEPEVNPESVTGSTPALTPSTEHRAPKDSPPVGGFANAWCDIFQQERSGAQYVLTHQDGMALRELNRKANGDEAEILRRGRLMLRRTKYPQGSSLVDLNRHWNAYAAPEPVPIRPDVKGAPEKPKRDPNLPEGEIRDAF